MTTPQHDHPVDTLAERVRNLHTALDALSKRVPGDGDGDGIPNEGKNRKKGSGMSGGPPFKLTSANERTPTGQFAGGLQTRPTKVLLGLAAGKFDHKEVARNGLAQEGYGTDGKWSREARATAKPTPKSPDSEAKWTAQDWHRSVIGSAPLAVRTEIANGKLDPTHLVRSELAARGVDKQGKWVGFPAAKKAWGF